METAKEVFTVFQYNFCYCSMSTFGAAQINATKFQYNFCYCSIRQRYCPLQKSLCFNTTFVTVLSAVSTIQVLVPAFQYNFCYCSMYCYQLSHYWSGVSIQLLLLFYSRKKCVIFRLNRFNTTFVTVLSCIWIKNCAFKNSFNTTFVTVLFYPH